MPSAAQIEDIIRVVVERLRGMEAAQVLEQSSHKTQLVARQHESPAATSDASTLKLDAALVTLESLRGKLTGIRTIQVPARAVVTPAVQDELRDRGVKLERVATTPPMAKGENNQKVLLVASSSVNSAALPGPVINEGGQVAQTLELLKKHNANAQHLAIWCTDRAFAAVMATRSIASLRAVQLGDLGELEEALEQANPNVLVLNARQWTAASLSNLIRLCKGRS